MTLLVLQGVKAPVSLKFVIWELNTNLIKSNDVNTYRFIMTLLVLQGVKAPVIQLHGAIENYRSVYMVVSLYQTRNISQVFMNYKQWLSNKCIYVYPLLYFSYFRTKMTNVFPYHRHFSQITISYYM